MMTLGTKAALGGEFGDDEFLCSPHASASASAASAPTPRGRTGHDPVVAVRNYTDGCYVPYHDQPSQFDWPRSEYWCPTTRLDLVIFTLPPTQLSGMCALSPQFVLKVYPDWHLLAHQSSVGSSMRVLERICIARRC